MSRTLRCPSAQPGMAGLEVLGVQSGDEINPDVTYLNQRLAATEDILAMAAPVPASSVFRLSANCEQERCAHFDGHKCQLASRIVTKMARAVSKLPPCNIRKECRWFAQEGRSACYRCPNVSTLHVEPSVETAQIATGDAAS